jgi:hypothetical protein
MTEAMATRARGDAKWFFFGHHWNKCIVVGIYLMACRALPRPKDRLGHAPDGRVPFAMLFDNRIEAEAWLIAAYRLTRRLGP